MPKRKEWFGEWFDSPYYHILYKHRDYEEARSLIDHITTHLLVTKDHKILDLACGKGRHSIYMNEKGFDVVGIDLSEQSITHANQFANNRLHFEVHDMRKPFAKQEFDFIFNLFTSFGYFETKQEHETAILSAAAALKPNGKMVIDFLNPYTVIHNLKPEEMVIINDIEFHIEKSINKEEYILKDIRFEDKGESFHFREKVKALRRVDFLNYFEKANLKVVKLFGDYELNPYVAEQSDRMIFVAKKSA